MDPFTDLDQGGADLLEGGRDFVYLRRGSAVPIVVRGLINETAETADPNGSYGNKIVVGLVTLHVADTAVATSSSGALFNGVPDPQEGDRVSFGIRSWVVRNHAPAGMGMTVLQLDKPS